MKYWFTRIIYFSAIPLSILASIGFIELMFYLKKKILLLLNLNFFHKLNFGVKYFIFFLIVFFSLSNISVMGIYWYDITKKGYYLEDDEAQIIGWISNNIPKDSNFLIDRYILYYIEDITFCNTFYLNQEIKKAISNFTYGTIEMYKEENCNINVSKIFNSHINVLHLIDYNNKGISSIKINFDENQSFGYFEFFIMTSDSLKKFFIDLLNEDIVIIRFSLQQKEFKYFDGNKYINISNLENNKFYYCKISFQCTDSYNNGLKQYKWIVEINNNSYGEFDFLINSLTIDSMRLYTDEIDQKYMISIDNFNLSWTNKFNIEFQWIPKILNYLRNKNINYLILSKEKNLYQKETEYYLNISKDLLHKYFNKTLYQYKRLTIYKGN
ncbi:MAG: hypothetical protein ACTSQP_19235 [Promethearchaeota archaeon]